MPQRTNDFQELVTLIQHALAPKGARITPSALVDVAGQPSNREIDVLIESGVGPYSIKIAVESRDEGRKMDQTAFEEFLGKYFSDRSIKVNKLVIITHRGFCEPVIERAAAYGSQIELLTYSQISTTDWAKLYPETIVFKMAPHLCSIAVKPEIPGYEIKRLQKEGRIVCIYGTDFGTVEEYVQRTFQNKILVDRPTLFDELDARAAQEPNGQAIATVTIPNDLNHPNSLIIDGNGYLLEEISFTIHVINGKAPIQYSGCEIKSDDGKSTVIPLAEATVGGKRIKFVLPSKHNPNRMVVKIDTEHPSPAERAKRDKKRKHELKRKLKRR